MKTLIRFISGFAASLLLAAGLNAAANKLDPLSQDAGHQDPGSITNDKGPVSTLPCTSCTNEE